MGLLEGPGQSPADWRPATFALVLFIGFSSGLGYLTWLYALATANAAIVTAFLALSPLVATCLSIAFLSAEIEPGLIAALALVVAGLLFLALPTPAAAVSPQRRLQSVSGRARPSFRRLRRGGIDLRRRNPHRPLANLPRCPTTRPTMTQDARSELTVPGTLRVGINLSNMLLVTGTGPRGEPRGVAPDMAAALAARLGVGVSYVTFPRPGELADAVAQDAWDVGLIAVEPKRAEMIAFSAPYVEIEATYLVPADSPIQSIEELDRPGIRIAVADRAAYDLYLTRTLQHATLHRATGLPAAFELFVAERHDALAGLVPALQENAKDLPGARVLEGRYTSVQQAVGSKPEKTALKTAIAQFVAEAKASGLVAELIEKHGVTGKLQVAAAT